MRQARRALAAAFALGGFASLLQLALPFYVLHVLDSAIPAASLVTLALLTLIAAGALLALVCLAAARDRILLRAGLWLDHTLGAHMLANGARLGTPPAELERDAEALALLSRGLAERSVAAALDAAWLPIFLAALALINPVMAVVAAIGAGLLVLAMLVAAPRLGRLAQQKASAGRGTAAWWLAAGAQSADVGLPPGAAEQWERLNRPHIAAAYALGRRRARLDDLARVVRAGAQVALIAVGAWLVVGHALTPAGLIACVLLSAALLEPLERLVAALPAVSAAISAYRQLDALPADAPTREDAYEPRSDPAATAAPRLEVRGPLAVGFAALLLLIAAGLGAASTRLSDLAGLAGGPVFETRRAAVTYPADKARVLVAEGAAVEAGDVIVTLDTFELDRQITMLKALSEAVKAQLALVGRETIDLAAPADASPLDRAKVASLEQRIGELEKESQELLARLAVAERELTKSQIRAPVTGRVVALGVRGTDAASGQPTAELEIATADRPLLQRLLAPLLSEKPAASQPIRPIAELGREP